MLLFQKWDEIAKKETHIDRLDATLSKYYQNLCNPKDANKIKSRHSFSFSIFYIMGLGLILGFKGFCSRIFFIGIGNWMLNLLKEYFKTDEVGGSVSFHSRKLRVGM